VEKDIKKRDALKAEIATLTDDVVFIRKNKHDLRTDVKNLETTIADNKLASDKIIKLITADEKFLRDLRDKKVEIGSEISEKENAIKLKEAKIKDDEDKADKKLQDAEVLITDSKIKNDTANELLASAKGKERDITNLKADLIFEKAGILQLKKDTEAEKIKATANKEASALVLDEIEKDKEQTSEFVENAKKIVLDWNEKIKEVRGMRAEGDKNLKELTEEKTKHSVENSEIKAELDLRGAEQDTKEAQQKREDEEIAKREKAVQLKELQIRKVIKDNNIEADIKKLEAALK